ncbi:MAG: tetratricopeptide repeat protein [Verrucomicrobiota bacterium]
MSRNKRVRRQTRLSGVPEKPPKACARQWNRRLGLSLALAGLIGVLVMGYEVVKKHRQPIGADFSGWIEGHQANTQAGLDSKDSHSPLNSTNRPGAVRNMEAEGRADDLHNEGANLFARGEPLLAIQKFKHALALQPDDEALHFALACAFAKVGDSTNAEREYVEALRLLPDYPEAHNNYGNLLLNSGRMNEAKAHLVEAVNAMPESAEFNNNLGVLLQRRHETNQAILSFQKAVQCDSNYVDGHYNLGMSYYLRQEPERAAAEFREALRIKPDHKPALRALSRLTSKP